MPYVWVDNELFHSYRGINIYEQGGTCSHRFGTLPDADVDDFGQDKNVFDLLEYRPGAEPKDYRDVLREMIDEVFDRGSESFLYKYLPIHEMLQPDDRPSPDKVYKSTIVMWSRGREEGLGAVRMLADAYPESVVYRDSCESPEFPAEDDGWSDVCDEMFRKGA